MATERLSMRKLRELLRQRLELKLSVREIARSLGIGVGTVNRYLYRAQAAKLTSWPLAPELDDDAALTALLFADEGKVVASRPEPDWAHVHAELRRKGVTKLLLWQEYREGQPEGYQYSQFCERYARWVKCASSTGPSSRPSERRRLGGGGGTSRPAFLSSPSLHVSCRVVSLEFFDTLSGSSSLTPSRDTLSVSKLAE